MRRRVNKKLIGLFTITGIILFVGAILLFLSDKIFFRKENLVVLYFEETIQGLNIGSPVVFRGVEIGKVAKIDLVADPVNYNFSIPVYIKLNKEQIFRLKDNKIYDNKKIGTEKFVDSLVEKGLKARLATYSLITGQLMIELEILPNIPMIMRNKINDEHLVEIPTILSSKGELSKGLQDLPLKDIVDQFNVLLQNINLYAPDILKQTSLFTNSLNKSLSGNSVEFYNMLNNFNKTINDIGEAARALRNFADYVERHPESLIKGKGDY